MAAPKSQAVGLSSQMPVNYNQAAAVANRFFPPFYKRERVCFLLAHIPYGWTFEMNRLLFSALAEQSSS